ncbi:KAP family P-loop NTPase fold protein [Ruegeria conchae]|uniref:KAP-like P-loop domain-containing protein n=1 Tax=Ruegeria conchae TaxID=981384 RepID=A0A497Z2J5_9RHOB|nr:KAP P-loop domain-containing protein [Ruegeria conchae]RLK02611.1 KAP-like P-loop domain-containing protein [Ruegeria conchae]
MRLTIPEPKIKLYEDGFDEHDKLSRKTTGDKLSELVERIDDPMVVALDGAWGSGKSFFLKCWVGEHLRREGNTTQTVYFDAFKHDFLDDPLIALTGAIAERFKESGDKTAQKAWDQAKRVAPALGRAIIRAGISVATAGLVNKADQLADAAIETASRELDEAIAEFWKRESGKRVAMECFRQALVDLTDPDVNGLPARKLVIVVDELDRCRPDYALSLLETIKHFFNVDGVHFILGVNLEQLQNSVKARCGSGTEADAYLQKFYPLKLKLPRMIQHTRDHLHYFNYASAQMQIPIPIHETTRALLGLYSGHLPMTLRAIQRVLSVLVLIPPDRPQYISDKILVTVAIVKVCAPLTYELMRENKLTPQDLQEVFNFDQSDLALWTRVLRAASGHEEVFRPSKRLIPENLLPEICDEYLEVFDSSALQFR